MALYFFLFGLIVGSFLNVVIVRQGVRPITGRSACMVCKRQILWYDNIPIISWLILKGRCRFCKSWISAQYILVEGTTGVLFALIGAAPIPLTLQIIALPIVALFLAITVYDLYHTIIPDAWVYPASFFALVFSLAALWLGTTSASYVLLLAAGPLCALPFYLLWLVSRGTWMGLGDAKLALAIGWLLGLWQGIEALFIAFLLGGAVGAVLLLHTHLKRNQSAGYTMKSEIPFGPFLIVGCFSIWFLSLYNIYLPLFGW